MIPLTNHDLERIEALVSRIRHPVEGKVLRLEKWKIGAVVDQKRVGKSNGSSWGSIAQQLLLRRHLQEDGTDNLVEHLQH